MAINYEAIQLYNCKPQSQIKSNQIKYQISKIKIVNQNLKIMNTFDF